GRRGARAPTTRWLPSCGGSASGSSGSRPEHAASRSPQAQWTDALSQQQLGAPGDEEIGKRADVGVAMPRVETPRPGVEIGDAHEEVGCAREDDRLDVTE